MFEFISHNCDLFHNCDFISHYCNILHNCDITDAASHFTNSTLYLRIANAHLTD